MFAALQRDADIPGVIFTVVRGKLTRPFVDDSLRDPYQNSSEQNQRFIERQILAYGCAGAGTGKKLPVYYQPIQFDPMTGLQIAQSANTDDHEFSSLQHSMVLTIFR